MDVRKAAYNTMCEVMIKTNMHFYFGDWKEQGTDEFKKDPEGISPAHAMYLLTEVIRNSTMKNDKANRWLAWGQCILTLTGFLTLEQCKQINKEA